MSATTVRAPRPWTYRGWCEACHDGLNSRTKREADEWAEDHNSRHHREGNQ